MTPKSLDTSAIRERLEKASARPWRFDPTGWINTARMMEVFFDCNDKTHAAKVAEVVREADGELIAHAPSDLKALLEEVETLRAAVIATAKVLDKFAKRAREKSPCQDAVGIHFDCIQAMQVLYLPAVVALRTEKTS